MEILFYVAKWKDAKYLCVVVFGYTLHHLWGEHKPEKFLKWTMQILLPFLFGAIGASVRYEELTGKAIGISIGIFVFTTVVRFIATMVVAFIQCHNWREAAFLGFAWMPKGSVTATVGSVIYDFVNSSLPDDHPQKAEYKEYGLQILTTAILTVVVMEPIGVALIATMSSKLLRKEVGEVEDAPHKEVEI